MNFFLNNKKLLTFILYPQLNPIKNQVQLQEIRSLTKRLCIQTWRRPSTFIINILEPILWLVLFSALFQNAPITFFTPNYRYGHFISAGIIVFTIFTGSLNAGLPLVFDREFGFLNRLLCSPINNRYSIIISSSFNIIITSTSQVITIMGICYWIGYDIITTHNLWVIIPILFSLSSSITNISLIFALILPGHIELLALIVIINLPSLFSSTALAPLIFMPSWLQIIASINPLSYAIEIIRYNYKFHTFSQNCNIMNTVWGQVNFKQTLLIFLIINTICFSIAQYFISQKFDE